MAVRRANIVIDCHDDPLPRPVWRAAIGGDVDVTWRFCISTCLDFLSSLAIFSKGAA